MRRLSVPAERSPPRGCTRCCRRRCRSPAGAEPVGVVVRDAQVDQARLLDARDDLDRVAQGLLRRHQEGRVLRARRSVLVPTARTEPRGMCSGAGRSARGTRARAPRPRASGCAPLGPSARATRSRTRSSTCSSPWSWRATTMWELFDPRSMAARTVRGRPIRESGGRVAGIDSAPCDRAVRPGIYGAAPPPASTSAHVATAVTRDRSTALDPTSFANPDRW